MAETVKNQENVQNPSIDTVRIRYNELVNSIRFLGDVSVKIHGLCDENEIYRTLLDEFRKSKQYIISILLLTDDKSHLRFVGTSASSKNLKAAEKASGFQQKTFRIDLAKSKSYSQVIEQGKIVHTSTIEIIKDVFPRGLTKLAPLIAKILGYEKKTSVLLPIHTKGSVVGVIGITPPEQLEDFVPSVENFSRQVSAALELTHQIAKRKQVEEELLTHRNQLEKLVEKRTAELQKELFDRSQIEDALVKSEDRFRSYAENAPDFVVQIDPEGTILFINRTVDGGVRRDEILGTSVFSWIPEDYHPTLRQILSLVFEKAEAHVIEHPVGNTQRENFWFSSHLGPIGEPGSVTSAIIVARDITEQMKAEEALRESDEKFSTLFRSSTTGIAIVTLEGKFLDVNDSFLKMLGYTFEELKALSYPELTPQEWHKIEADMLTKALVTGELRNFEKEYIRKDGTLVPVFINAWIIKDKEGKPSKLGAIVTDISARKKAEEELQNSEERFRSLTESTSDWIWETDKNAIYTYTNPKVRELLGYEPEEILGKTPFDFMPPNEAERISAEFDAITRTGNSFNGLENQLLHRDGRVLIVETSGVPIIDSNGAHQGYRGIDRDVTDRKRAEDKLQNTQKLESLGFLAGGIAHDFNNLLSGIFGNIQLAMIHSSSKEEVSSHLETAMQSMKLATDLTHQLLTFSSGGAPVIKQISFSNILTESITFSLSGSNIHPDVSIDQNMWPVEADQGQIHQVFNNILLNARQAMPEGGSVEISTENLTIQSNTNLPLSEGKYVRIAIKDSGIGMPEGILKKIFDPFFTTKHSGSGLGLSICYSIVAKHNGHITVESRPGTGSVFTLYLPAAEKEMHKKPWKQDTLLRGEGRILIMDDDLIICKTLARELKMLGYESETTINGDEAIKAYGEALTTGKRFNAAILDLTIRGGKGGKETIAELRNIDPDIKAIVSSGYSDDPVLAHPEKFGFSGAIEKPYMLEDLSQVIYDLLN